MALPRYSLDDGADDDEEVLDESYRSVGSSSRPYAAAGGASSSLQASALRAGSPSFSTSGSAAEAGASSLDIDDLLRSSTPTHSHSAARSGKGWPYSSSCSIARMSAFEQLTLFMATQKAAPELLPFPTSAFETLLGQMEQQQSIVDSLLQIGSTTEQDEIDEDEFLRLNMVQVDLERAKWLVKLVTRTRLDLAQKFAGFIHARPAQRAKLNPTEARFVQDYWQLKKDHFDTAVLGFLPEQLREIEAPGQDTFSQQDTHQANTSTNMRWERRVVPGPDLDGPVFVRCLDECGTIQLPDGESAILDKDSIHLLRYRSVRHLVYQGSVVLL